MTRGRWSSAFGTTVASRRFLDAAVAEPTGKERSALRDKFVGATYERFRNAKRRLAEACDADPLHASQGCDETCDANMCRVYFARLIALTTAREYAESKAEYKRAISRAD